MDREKALSYSAGCFKGQPASCMCSCPFNVDIRGFADKMKNGRYSSAYRQLRNDLVFPETVSELCDAPCEGSCVRQFLDESVKIRSLEAACFDLTKKKDPQPYRLPARNERIAVIGGGISGLICAYRLAIRKYSVTVFESSDGWGGSLREHPAWEMMEREIATQISLEKTEFVFNKKTDITDAESFDALYVATGAGGDDFGLLDGWDPSTLAAKRTGTFLGGKLTGCNDVTACLHGIRAAQHIEAYILSGKMPVNSGDKKDGFCGHYINTQGRPVIAAVIPSGGIYTSEEAAAEASRCLSCDCTECMDACEMLQKYRKDPIRITTEIYQDAVAVA
ncbi:MAG: FAD-dependent oxidoreductase, partial [Eubacteriaceae bacterium]|nr:FAD-dependent oxidoreductase [Eubacteriaceae bacterium]